MGVEEHENGGVGKKKIRKYIYHITPNWLVDRGEKHIFSHDKKFFQKQTKTYQYIIKHINKKKLREKTNIKKFIIPNSNT
jgi:hypothetical protein